MFTHTLNLPPEHLWYQTFHSMWDKAISMVKSKMFPNGVLVVCIGSVTSCSGYLCFPKQGKVGALLNLDAWVFAFSDSCFSASSIHHVTIQLSRESDELPLWQIPFNVPLLCIHLCTNKWHNKNAGIPPHQKNVLPSLKSISPRMCRVELTSSKNLE